MQWFKKKKKLTPKYISNIVFYLKKKNTTNLN